MSESNDERIARKRREREEFLKQQAADEALARKLDNDPEFAKDFDKSFEIGFKGLEDDIIGREAAKLGFTDKQIQKALEDAHRARKVAKGGFLTNADPEKAQQIINENLVLNKLSKQQKKGCAVVALAGLAVGATTLGALFYGAADALAQVMR